MASKGKVVAVKNNRRLKDNFKILFENKIIIYFQLTSQETSILVSSERVVSQITQTPMSIGFGYTRLKFQMTLILVHSDSD